MSNTAMMAFHSYCLLNPKPVQGGRRYIYAASADKGEGTAGVCLLSWLQIFAPKENMTYVLGAGRSFYAASSR